MSPSLLTNFRWYATGEPQSMLIESGRVVWRGADGPKTAAETVDLGGATIAPKFIDNHCHVLPTGLDLQKLHLGACSTKEEVLQAVRDKLWEVEPGRWLMAVHYD